MTTMPHLVLCEIGATELTHLDNFSPFCVKVHRALRWAGLEYERRNAGNPADFRGHNPLGQVPVLLIDGEPVCDSTRILAAIDKLSGGALLPQDGPRRSEALLWEELADTSLNTLLITSRWADDDNWKRVNAAFFLDRMPPVVRQVVPGLIRRRVLRDLQGRDAIRTGLNEHRERLAATLDQLEGFAPRTGFWVGETFTVADAAIFGQVQSFRTMLTPREADAIESRPTLCAYLDRIDMATRSTRPADAATSAPTSDASAVPVPF